MAAALPRDGVLVMDKPAGPSSHDVVAAVRRLLRIRRVGHTGTLDPMATGVLVLCLGRGTRLARFLTAAEKSYRGTLRLGWETDTLDGTGRPLSPTLTPVVATGELAEALAGLTGPQSQVPPAFSAKRIGGTRAYRLAREGRPQAPPPVAVEVHEFQCREVGGGELAFEVRCSAGTYIRALARDLGRRLGCGAHLTSLRRTRCGEFREDQAVSLEALAALVDDGREEDALVPLERLELGMPALVVREDALRRVRHGTALEPGDWQGSPPSAGRECRLLDPSGALLGVASVERGEAGQPRLQPRVVLAAGDPAAAGLGPPAGQRSARG